MASIAWGFLDSPPLLGKYVSLPTVLQGPYNVPVLAAPRLLASGPEPVKAPCQVGIIGHFSTHCTPRGTVGRVADRQCGVERPVCERQPGRDVRTVCVQLARVPQGRAVGTRYGQDC